MAREEGVMPDPEGQRIMAQAVRVTTAQEALATVDRVERARDALDCVVFVATEG